VPVDQDRPPDIGSAISAAFAADVSSLIRHHARTMQGDPEGLHGMRVAARRLRSDLLTFDAFLDRGWAGSLDVELEWLGDLLAAVRNADVWGQMIDEQGRDLGPGIDAVAKDVARQREAAWVTLAGELASSHYLDLVDRLVRAARAPLLQPGASGRADRLIGPRVSAAAANVGKSASRLGKRPTDRDFHRVRILVKRLRYAAETALPYDREPEALETLASKAKKLQDVLGTLQDTVTLRDVLDEFSQGNRTLAAPSFAAGRLAERQETMRLALRARVPNRLRALRKAIRAWEGS
jgi:CHAD domain-containing protein